ncbi:LAQU0S06e03224g1_1 [Lachancea quebecensis]|uniref:LAQU0S06e03224g1_1 n=1 Tax=Lachancea quebecensis TaxID=1654605 RepID=A0A0P1KU42_9SACH|nr:LAQU0S06e03224g1_1 [Lachancea quebecensis]
MREENKPLLGKEGPRQASSYASPNIVPCDTESSERAFDAIDMQIHSPPSMSNHVADQTQLTLWHRLTYYLPCFSWLPTYDTSKLLRDFVAGASLASFQIPLAMSYSTSVAHVPPICGLNALAFTPFVYAIFGSVPHMIVGPESAISLVVGQAIEKQMKHDKSLDVVNLCLILTFISGTILFSFGIMRFGYLDSVLSRALLRGFISAVGLVMVLNSLITELKLKKVFNDAPGHYHAPFQKLIFLFHYAPGNYHVPTALLSLSSFSILMSLKLVKKRLSRVYKKVIFVPEILIVVSLVTLASYYFSFKSRYNIDIVGDIEVGNTSRLRNPLSRQNLALFNDLFHAGFMVALLGFFESTTASKSLGSSYELSVSSNRELVALGSLNLVGSIFGALPSFGGYGRSKINAYSGAATVMSGVFMGLITCITSMFLLNAIHHIPVCVLSVITTMVGITLFEEAPADLRYHFRCRGYNELLIFALTVLTTFFYSVEAGITLGCGYSVIRVIKNSTKSKIQILRRVSGTNQFVNADDFNSSTNTCVVIPPRLDDIEGSLIVKIPERLTFMNTEDLKTRLYRLEKYGSVNTHPASPKLKNRSQTRHMIFDMNGMTEIDSSASQILQEIIIGLRKRDVHVYLTRVPLIASVRERLVASGVIEMVEKCDASMAAVDCAFDNWCFKTIQDALRVSDEVDVNSIVEVASECTSISGTFLHSSAV